MYSRLSCNPLGHDVGSQILLEESRTSQQPRCSPRSWSVCLCIPRLYVCSSSLVGSYRYRECLSASHHTSEFWITLLCDSNLFKHAGPLLKFDLVNYNCRHLPQNDAKLAPNPISTSACSPIPSDLGANATNIIMVPKSERCLGERLNSS